VNQDVNPLDVLLQHITERYPGTEWRYYQFIHDACITLKPNIFWETNAFNILLFEKHNFLTEVFFYLFQMGHDMALESYEGTKLWSSSAITI